jgi:putative toxin-antitoxin system antitoxin component (TIGR02293 family)
MDTLSSVATEALVMNTDASLSDDNRGALTVSRAVPDLTAAAAREGVTGFSERCYIQAFGYLGGKRFWDREPCNRMDVHAAILSGVSYGSVVFLVSQVKRLEAQDVAEALGFSTESLRRLAKRADDPMPASVASKAWCFAEILAKATAVCGDRELAELWMSDAAIGLGGQRPIEMLRTFQGAELVDEFLTRLAFGVYC